MEHPKWNNIRNGASMRKEKGNQKLNAFFPSLLKFEYMEAIAHKHVYFTYSHGSISSYFFSMFTKELIEE